MFARVVWKVITRHELFMSLHVNQLSDKQIALNKISIQIVTF